MAERMGGEKVCENNRNSAIPKIGTILLVYSFKVPTFTGLLPHLFAFFFIDSTFTELHRSYAWKSQCRNVFETISYR